ncbi:hypothetical protein FQZ97_857590 [compost metagenome]
MIGAHWRLKILNQTNDNLADNRRDVGSCGRAPHLVVNDLDQFPLFAEPQHGLDEIGAVRAKDPGGP